MNIIRQPINQQFKTLALLCFITSFSIALLTIRIKITHTNFYLFLVWNLFLAFIPFAITTFLKNLQKISKLKFIIWFGIWLLFLPNAPYIITDLLHLRLGKSHLLWLDILIISSFSFVGLIVFYLSILDMKTILSETTKTIYLNLSIIVIFVLCGFGVYLGRFLRYNSWEIIQNPMALFSDILKILTQPNTHTEAWLFTILFGAFLCVGYFAICNLRITHSNKIS